MHEIYIICNEKLLHSILAKKTTTEISLADFFDVSIKQDK